MNDPLLLQDPPSTSATASPFHAARVGLAAAAGHLLAVPDDALGRPWSWREGAVDVRYGFYRIFEGIERATAQVEEALTSGDVRPARGARLIAPATAARWDLHGLVRVLSAAELDRDPGAGEWTIRQTLRHIVSGQRGYGLQTLWWLDRRGQTGPLPARMPADALPPRPTDEAEGSGSPEAILARLDALLDLGSDRLSSLDADALAVPARWAGIEVDIDFRLVRWSSHLREHAVQVEKTLAMLGRAPTEVERLVRLIHGAYGRLEAAAYGWPSTALTAKIGGHTVAEMLETVGHEMVGTATTVRDAAAG